MTWLNLVELSKLWQFSDVLDKVLDIHSTSSLSLSLFYTHMINWHMNSNFFWLGDILIHLLMQ